MALSLNIGGMEIYLNIKGYEKTNSENWDDTWCNVDFTFKLEGCINYSKNNDSILLAHEVECFEERLTELLENKLQQIEELYAFIEPDFEFRLCSRNKIISANWIINLWHKGELTANSFLVTMDRADITKLRDYLRSVINV